MSDTTVLIVEDEARLAQVMSDYLRQAGYQTEIRGDGEAGLAAARELKPDLILLDLMLPKLDGLAVCREVRKSSQIPIIMVTAKVEEIDRLLGLELGADDYICKPFSPREVVARCKAIFRRSQRKGGHWQEESALRLDVEGQRVWVGELCLELTPTEYRLFRAFFENQGRVFSRDRLLDLAYDPDQDVSDRVIDSHVKNLRKKLAQALPGKDLIHSVYGVGYRYEE